jgi:type VI protein secretion system component Hcp
MKTKAKPLSKKAMKKTKGGAADMFLKITGVKGEIQDTMHKDQIDVLQTARTGKI